MRKAAKNVFVQNFWKTSDALPDFENRNTGHISSSIQKTIKMFIYIIIIVEM
jgi:hypothetical protein